MARCRGFIDGSIRRIARAGKRQSSAYSGWKRHHCLKYNSVKTVETPDGVLRHHVGGCVLLVDGATQDSLPRVG